MSDFDAAGSTMSDHQDSEHFDYNRSWEEIESMLDKAERVKNQLHIKFLNESNKKKKLYYARNYKALEGVCKTLRWVLGDKNVDHPLE
jgi:hypothetical protein